MGCMHLARSLWSNLTMQLQTDRKLEHGLSHFFFTKSDRSCRPEPPPIDRPSPRQSELPLPLHGHCPRESRELCTRKHVAHTPAIKPAPSPNLTASSASSASVSRGVKRCRCLCSQRPVWQIRPVPSITLRVTVLRAGWRGASLWNLRRHTRAVRQQGLPPPPARRPLSAAAARHPSRRRGSRQRGTSASRRWPGLFSSHHACDLQGLCKPPAWGCTRRCLRHALLLEGTGQAQQGLQPDIAPQALQVSRLSVLSWLAKTTSS